MCDCFARVCGVSWSPAAASAAEGHVLESHEHRTRHRTPLAEAKRHEQRAQLQTSTGSHAHLPPEEAGDASRAAQKEKLHAELKQVLQTKGAGGQPGSGEAEEKMDAHLRAMEKTIEASELLEVIVETEAEAGASGMSVAGGGKEGLFVKDVLRGSPAAQALSLREGDQLLSARVYFDNMRYEDALQILQSAAPYRISFCLKRTVPSTDVTRSPGAPTFEVRGPKAKMAKLSIQSLTSLKKKQKAAGKGVAQRLGEAAGRSRQGPVGSKQEGPPVDVEFSLPVFSKLRKAKSTGEVAAAQPSPERSPLPSSLESKRRKLKLPRLKVREALAARAGGGEGRLEVVLPKTAPEQKATAKEGIGGKVSKFTAPFSRGKKPKEESGVRGEAGLQVPQVELDLSLPTVGSSGESPKAGAKHEGFPVQVLPLGLPKVEMALPKGSLVGLEAPGDSLPAGLKLPTAEVAIPKVDVGLSLPRLEGTTPGMTPKGEGFPFKVPKVGVSTEETEGKLAPLDFVLGKCRASGLEEKVAMPPPGVGLPSVDLAIPLPRKKPETEAPKPKVEVPDVSIKVPAFSLPKLGSKPHEAEESGMPQVELCVGKPGSPKAKAKSPPSQARGLGLSLMERRSESKEAPAVLADSKMRSPGLKVPALDMQLPKVLVGLAAPAPGAEAVEGPRFKIQMPQVSLPRGSFPSKAVPSPPQMPKPEGNARVPALDLSLPAAKLLEAQLPKGHVSKPELDLSVDQPQVEVALPPARLSFPSARAPALELDLPKVGIELDLPKADSECWASSHPARDQEIKLKMPSLETLSRDLEVEISVPKRRGDQLDLEPGLEATEGPDVGAIIARIPKVDLALGKEQAAEVSLVHKEGAELGGLVKGGQGKLPAVEVSAIKFPEVTREGGKSREVEGRAKPQKFALPKFSISSPKTWKVGAETFAARAESPEAADRGSKLKMLKFGVSFPKSKWGGEVESPRPAEKGEGDTPKERGLAVAPDGEPSESRVKLPSVELPLGDVSIGLSTGKAESSCEGGTSPLPEVGIELPDLKPKMPKFSLPKFGSRSKESEVELETGEAKPSGSRGALAGAQGAKGSGKDVGAKASKFKMPLFSMARRDQEVLRPDADSKTKKGPESPKEKPRGPSVKMPQLKLPSAVAEVGHAHVPQVELPKISFPTARAGEVPLVGSESPGLQVRAPLLEIAMPGTATKGEPGGEASGVAVKSYEGELAIPKAPSLGISAPKVEFYLRLPSAGAEATVPPGATGADAKIKLPQVELPKFGRGEGAGVQLLGRGEEPETAGASTLGAKIQLPKVGITLPKTQLPGVELPRAEGEGGPAGPGGVFKMPSVGLPKFSTPKGKALEQEPVGSLEGGRMLPTIPLSCPAVTLPKLGGSSVGGEGETEAGLPQLELKVPRLTGSTEVMLGPETGGKGAPVKVPASFGLCKADGEAEAGAVGEVAVCGPDSKFKLKIPSLSLSKTGVEPRTDTQPLCPSPKEGDVSFKMPQIALPDVGFSVDQDDKRAAKVEVGKRASAEGLEVEGFEGRLKMPKIKIPALGVSVPKGSQDTAAPESPGSSGGGEPDGKKATFKVPDVELSTPTLKAHAEYEVEGAQLWHGGSQELEVAGSRVRVGSDGRKGPGGKGEPPDAAAWKKYKVKIPKFGLSLPKAGEGVSGQDAEAKIKKPVFVLARPKGKGAEGASGLLEGEEDTGGKGVGGRFKQRPAVGLSLPKLKMGAEVNGELEDGGLGKGASKVKLPKVGFSMAEGALVHGERAEDLLQNDTQGKLGKLRLPQLELSSPSALAESDPELSLQLVRGDEAKEEGASEGPGGAFAALKFKPPQITFSGFKKRNGEAAPGPVVSSAARTEMASLERGEGAKGEKSPKFKFPKLALSPKPHVVLEIASKGQARPEEAGRGAPEGLNVQLPRVGFSEEAAEGGATAAV